jgi:site-specific DNA recombinase
MAKRHTLPASGDGAKLPEMVGAVIYVRVSTKEQTENLSLPTQLRACEEYCRRHGYEILERFHEEGESARTTDRSQLQALLKYCRTHKARFTSSLCTTSRVSRGRSTTTSRSAHT